MELKEIRKIKEIKTIAALPVSCWGVKGDKVDKDNSCIVDSFGEDNGRDIILDKNHLSLSPLSPLSSLTSLTSLTF